MCCFPVIHCWLPGMQPPADVVTALLARALRVLPEMSMAEVVDSVAGLAAMQYRPPDAWLTHVAQQVCVFVTL
jgi:hypothetical protein